MCTHNTWHAPGLERKEITEVMHDVQIEPQLLAVPVIISKPVAVLGVPRYISNALCNNITFIGNE